MSLDLETRLRKFYASAPQRIHEVPTLEISHSQMSKTYYLWRETRPATAWTETGLLITLQPANFEVKLAGQGGNLDQQFTINLDLTDVQDEFREQLDRIDLDSEERVRSVFRVYLSDDLTAPQAAQRLQLESVNYQIGSATFSAASPRLNLTRTGELYTPRDIPMLRGFL
ncbi:DUF1833 family protein [Paucibacter sp. R3-3]|uniref:DUF1833 family protein n=1 Tax=Roseateles agri TaxID=3098619 RepID=A0ABU5DSZ6_9BURK|nr:DUF1833 family protein [Paucibacter sp. R3-3]MDY0748499.1 DUF1833 family protein [Paucibacter sp. R3-3]